MARLLAPSAWRTATSRCLASDRTRNRFATLAHATSSTRPTDASRIHSVSATRPTMDCCREIGSGDHSAWFGEVRARSAMRAVISVRASAIVAPSRNRATPCSVKRKDALARVDWAAIHSSVRGIGKRERRRHDADHLRRHAVQPDRLADDVRIESVAPRPEPVREHGDRRCTGYALILGEPPAKRRAHAQHRRERRRRVRRCRYARVCRCRSA